MPPTPPTVLTIAASDPCGGTGVEEDLKVITVHGCYGLSTITALTIPSEQGACNTLAVPAAFIAQSLDAVLRDIKPDAVKIGLPADSDTVDVITRFIEKRHLGRVVVDPIMKSTTKLPVDRLVEKFFSKVSLLTPNIAEAVLLVETARKIKWPEIRTEEDLVKLATAVFTLGPASVLLRGGRVPPATGSAVTEDGADDEVFVDGEVAVDILYDGKTVSRLDRKHIWMTNVSDSRCALTTAIASNLAKGFTMADAVGDAVAYIDAAIKASGSIALGTGRSPLYHARNCYVLPFEPGHLVDYLLGHPKVRNVWHEYTRHDFVKLLGTGELDTTHFRYYLIQDYLFLTQLARSNSLAAYKRYNIKDIAKAARLVTGAELELSKHIEYCEKFNLSRADIENSEEDIACTSYTRYILDVGASSDFLATQVAMLACTVGYADIGRWLYDSPDTKRSGNPYWEWITYYTSAEYETGVQIAREMVEEEARGVGVRKLSELVDIFARVTAMEKRFWSMALANSA